MDESEITYNCKGELIDQDYLDNLYNTFFKYHNKHKDEIPIDYSILDYLNEYAAKFNLSFWKTNDLYFCLT